ncbi:ABC transporter permease [Bacteroidota bacterium]
MIKRLIKVGLRLIFRKRGFYLINVIGLSIGISLFLAIALYIQNELSFEKMHKNLDRIYRVEQNRKSGDGFQNMATAPPPLTQALLSDFPEIEECTRFTYGGGTVTLENEDKFNFNDILFVDTSFFKMFSFPLIRGERLGGFEKPFTVVLSEKTAKTMFGDKDPIGKTINIFNDFDAEVTAVAKDITQNTHLYFDILISFTTLKEVNGEENVNRDWWSNWSSHFLMLENNTSWENLNRDLKSYLKKYQGENSENELYLQTLSRIHLHSTAEYNFRTIGDINNIYIYTAIGIFILIIACINFMNLTTAWSAKRSREVGIRKVSGASRYSLIFHFLGESFITTLISMFFAIILLESFLPTFNSFVGCELDIEYFSNWIFSFGLLALCVLVGFLSGFYPALVLSAFKPVKILKSAIPTGGKSPYLRRILVIFQFIISIVLISSTILIIKQIDYLKNKELGYDKENIVLLSISNDNKSKVNIFREDLLQNSEIINIGTSDYTPMNSNNWTQFGWEGAQDGDNIKMNINYIDHNFLQTYDIQIAEGKYFTEGMSDQEQMYVVINETALNDMGIEGEVIDKRIGWGVDYRNRDQKVARIAGIVKDFHFLPKQFPISPLIMPLISDESSGRRLSIKIDPKQKKKALLLIEEKYRELFPENIWNPRFTEDIMNNLYREETKMVKLVLFFAILAILIACLGLFGLISFISSQKTKEIGIRKILGSPISSILYKLSGEFFILLLIANVIAIPLTIWQINIWLQNFQYKIKIEPDVFIIGALISLIITGITISYRVIKSANQNPTLSLRYE